MRAALVIAYLFPPLGGPGVQRVLSLVRQLPRLGWRPVVIAADDRGRYWAKDETLLERIPPEVEVHRVPEGLTGVGVDVLRRIMPGPWRTVFDRAALVPDRQLPWLSPAVQAGLRVARSTGPEVIFATGAPWTNLLVGGVLARLLELPLVTDFRDPWTDGSVFEPLTAAHRSVHRALEAWTHRRASHIIANTQGNLRELNASFPETRGKSSCVPNGWDDEDFPHLPRLEEAPPLRVAYAGNFYAGRPVEEVLELFAEARAGAPSLAELQLVFAGHTNAGAAAERLGLPGVEDRGYLPLPAALGLLAAAHATLVTVPADARAGWVPQKLYQQLRLGRPVIVLSPPGEAAEIAVAAGQPVVDPRAPDARSRLATVLMAAQQGELPAPHQEVVARYDRRALARRIAQVLERAAGPPRLHI